MRTLAVIVGFLVLTACGGDDEPEPQPNGEACEIPEDCEKGTCLIAFGDPEKGGIPFPGGMCTNECSFEDKESCAEGETCLTYRPTGELYCFVDCDLDADPDECREEYMCTCIDYCIITTVCLPPF